MAQGPAFDDTGHHSGVFESVFTVENSRDEPIDGQPISIGVPCPVGRYPSVHRLSLTADAGVVHSYELVAYASWPDKSVQWLLVKAVISMPENAVMSVSVVVGAPTDPETTLAVTEVNSVIKVTDGDLSFSFDLDSGFLPTIHQSGNHDQGSTRDGLSGDLRGDLRGDLFLIDADNQRCRYEILNQFIESGSRGQIATITRHGRLHLAATNRELLVESTFTLYANTGFMACSLTVHNPSRALHRHGFWDLGDPGSVLFRSMAIEATGEALQKPMYSLADDDSFTTVDDGSLSIVQTSSGGLFRESKVHVQADGSLPDMSRCCVISSDDHTATEVDRASPVVRFDSTSGSVSVSMEQFWQNFPKAWHLGQNTFELALFPDIESGLHELQGGEKKTHQFFLSTGSAENALQWVRTPASITLNSKFVVGSGVFRYASIDHVDADYNDLLSLGIEGEHSFFTKRDLVDEYGWRHFGELYADHEVWLYGISKDFHSHYNNQYDPLSGFARQFALTGDPRWSTLMHDLARHVLDIDLYHTDEDRVEYNRGYFWHTNHHVSANTCTHRTFSSSHQSDLESHSVSGGPGDQHCYTTGFRFYYFLTGDKRARDALLSLTEWADKTINGSGCLIDGAVRFLRRGLRDGVQVMKGQHVFRYQYPMDRGTGNFIRALLNSYHLTGKRHYLQRAEHVIENTFSARDDLAARRFDDIEGSWYYTVFLQDVGDYLQLKREEGDFDNHFVRILRGFFHYLEWMREHEQPFLNQDSRLEFVNNTWAAQDIRKANLFYIAYVLSTKNREAYQQKAQFYREYVIDALRQSDTPWYTRIQAILHQNHGPSALMYTDSPMDKRLQNLNDVEIAEPFYSRLSFCLEKLQGLGRRLRIFSLANEINWVKSRSGKPVTTASSQSGKVMNS